MKQSFFNIAPILLISMILQSCNLNEEKIIQEVNRVLKSEHSTVDCSYKDGIVTLVGFVESKQDRLKAEKCVRQIRFVKCVKNNIAIGEPVLALNSNPDEFLRSYICDKLTTEGCDDVEVEVQNGEVTLTGHLKQNELVKVMRIANETKPKRVLTNLYLKHNK